MKLAEEAPAVGLGAIALVSSRHDYHFCCGGYSPLFTSLNTMVSALNCLLELPLLWTKFFCGPPLSGRSGKDPLSDSPELVLNGR